MPEDQPVEDVADRDSAIRTLVARLARPHPSGGQVVERASLLAAGDEFKDAVAWIAAHGGEPEFATTAPARSGAYRLRATPTGNGTGGLTPQRFILPASALRRRGEDAPKSERRS